MEIPPWLHGADVAGEYMRGLQLGASIGEEAARLAAEEHRTTMEAQAREETNRREATMQEQRIATEKAYHDSMLGLRKEALSQAAKVNAAKTNEAARKMADQQGFASDLAAGMPVDQALYRHPTLTTPAAAVAAHKSALNSTQSRLDIARKNLELRERELTDKENKREKIGTMDIPLPTPPGEFSGPSLKGVPLDSPLINQMMGTNAPPGTGTNFQQRASTPVPATAAPAAAKSPFKEGATVRSKKDGKLYRIVNGEPVPVKEES